MAALKIQKKQQEIKFWKFEREENPVTTEQCDLNVKQAYENNNQY